MAKIVLIVFIVVLVLAATVLALLAAGHRAPSRRAVAGGAATREVDVARDSHPLGVAMEQFARSLGPEDAVGPHPLDRDRYEAASEGAAAEGGAAKAAESTTRHWTEFRTWKELIRNKKACDQYLKDRADAINNPALDWSRVLKEIEPKLNEPHEYIGLVNLGPDGKLKLEAYERSPTKAGEEESETAFASVPGKLVAKYARRPALIIFHTHPADIRGDPMPSQHDLATSIHQSVNANYAANAVISRYGVITYGLDYFGYSTLNSAKDPWLARLNFIHDVIVSHTAMRSWSRHTMQDHLAFYPRHRLFINVYPSPEMVGDSHAITFVGSLEAPIDHDLIEDYHKEIIEHRKKAIELNNTNKSNESTTGSPRIEEIPL